MKFTKRQSNSVAKILVGGALIGAGTIIGNKGLTQLGKSVIVGA